MHMHMRINKLLYTYAAHDPYIATDIRRCTHTREAYTAWEAYIPHGLPRTTSHKPEEEKKTAIAPTKKTKETGRHEKVSS